MLFRSNENYTKVILNNNSYNNYLEANYSNVTLKANDNLNLQSANNSVYLESYDGSIYLNADSGNNVRIDGQTYISQYTYVNRIYDYSDGSNNLELWGYGTNDGYWFESGQGNDTTLWNMMNGANLNLIQTNSGKVNISSQGGSVNLYSADGFNVTGSMIVSDGSGVFNSSLVVNNSDLTLDGGSNQHMNDGAHLYFDTCGEIGRAHV